LEMVCNDRKQENGIFMLMVYKFRISLGGVWLNLKALWLNIRAEYLITKINFRWIQWKRRTFKRKFEVKKNIGCIVKWRQFRLQWWKRYLNWRVK
jgi:hypothetical protein